MQIHKNIFAKADVIVAPTTGVTAYSIFDDALKTGELDYINGAALVRYQIAGNFLGLPAVTVPVGYDKEGLPIGLQFIGKPWSEPTLMHIAFAMQARSHQEEAGRVISHHDCIASFSSSLIMLIQNSSEGVVELLRAHVLLADPSLSNIIRCNDWKAF
ncbi:hypothetical protein GOBAR_AA08471 [Gossypium barbadense]|uniref:Amidase domain-containing protein n=1 Tax=Gossypium barbadense TaxID=3634 RepID=A0A2P5Y9C0_GOSBA|nr:hypothetical protein GOBAR_AA08471 [Gossypium barbadense]